MARVLIVEDDENLREMIEEWLIFEKYTTSACGSGVEAIEHLDAGRFDCVILDWHLGDMTGIDILNKFRAGGGITPIMMLTGSNHKADRDLAMASGADTYICKPFKLHEISLALQELIAKGV
jgi:OmpR-family two-component system manganese-sensing response regulator